MSRFDYVIDKISDAPMRSEPFKHIYIDNLFSDEDFRAIVESREIAIPTAADDKDLFGKLRDAGFKAIDFPGCITDQQAYLDWHGSKAAGDPNAHSACEGFGMTLRLVDPDSDVLKDLKEFLASGPFNSVLARRFGVELADCTVDGGIQKYLDGYEISPHPDIRRKAATFMVNINPHAHSEGSDHHTHYMRLKSDRAYVGDFWNLRDDCDRCWVPWDWCETLTTQQKNNSIVLFSPGNDTMHAVKANYDHLAGQRTQLYGNLWYSKAARLKQVEWEHLSGGSIEAITIPVERRSLKESVSGLLPSSLKKALRGAKQPVHSDDYYRRDVL